MGIDFIYPEYEVARDLARCTRCGVCVAQCSNGVHIRREGNGALLSDNTKCVNCQRCVAFCPTRALKIVKSGCTFRGNANWDSGTVREVYLQAGSGGVLLSSMGSPSPCRCTGTGCCSTPPR